MIKINSITSKNDIEHRPPKIKNNVIPASFFLASNRMSGYVLTETSRKDARHYVEL